MPFLETRLLPLQINVYKKLRLRFGCGHQRRHSLSAPAARCFSHTGKGEEGGSPERGCLRAATSPERILKIQPCRTRRIAKGSVQHQETARQAYYIQEVHPLWKRTTQQGKMPSKSGNLPCLSEEGALQSNVSLQNCGCTSLAGQPLFIR